MEFTVLQFEDSCGPFLYVYGVKGIHSQVLLQQSITSIIDEFTNDEWNIVDIVAKMKDRGYELFDCNYAKCFI